METLAAEDREIVLSRVFEHPRERVFDALTDPLHIAEWWGPNGFTNTVYEMDVRPGGLWRFTMHGPDGKDYENRVRYLEVNRPEKLVYEHGDADPDDPNKFLVTMTLTEESGKTRLTQRSVFATPEQRKFVVGFGAVELGYQTLDRLARHLEGV